VGRLLSLSDNVVAFALTLLVLQLAVPRLSHAHANDPRAMATALRGNLGQLASYLMSFFVIAQFWLGHRRAFGHLTGHREGLAWWNFGFLLAITLMPFSSELLGNYGNNPVAVDVFAANMLLASVTSHGMLSYGRRMGLLAPGADAMAMKDARRRTIVTSVVVASIALAWLSTGLAEASWLLMVAAPRIAARMGPPRPASQLPGEEQADA
jgi:uncharacterized membrane protein